MVGRMRLFQKKRSELNPQLTGKGALAFWLKSDDEITMPGYTTLDHCPEIIAGVNRIASLIGSMTIHLMSNSDKGGDFRIKNELSKHVDVSPNHYQTRQVWMTDIVQTVLLKGNCIVFPFTRDGYLGDLVKIPPSRVIFSEHEQGFGYSVQIDDKLYDSEDVLHFLINPDPNRPWKGRGQTVALGEVAKTLNQAAATKKSFMSSKWKPSLIVKVDALTEEFSSPTGRKKLLESYVENSNAGEPWLIPAEQFSVEQVKPLSLSDLAISDSVKMDKETVASILGVPAFVLGVGAYNKDEWNNFINTTVMCLANMIQQELTKKLLISPNWYFKFNIRSLYNYDLQALEEVYTDLYVRGIVTGNEVRDVIGMTPKEGLDELVILENYIPLGTIGDQKKLVQNGGTE